VTTSDRQRNGVGALRDIAASHTVPTIFVIRRKWSCCLRCGHAHGPWCLFEAQRPIAALARLPDTLFRPDGPTSRNQPPALYGLRSGPSADPSKCGIRAIVKQADLGKHDERAGTSWTICRGGSYRPSLPAPLSPCACSKARMMRLPSWLELRSAARAVVSIATSLWSPR
jgi:hypothetical protein